MDPIKVFLVEDDEVYSFLLDQKLSEIAKFSLSTFTTGEECLEKLDMNPDIIILDYTLPGMNGLETLREIRKRIPDSHTIFLSGNEDENLIRQCREAGAYEYIVKDKDVAVKVYRTVNRLLEESANSRKERKKENEGDSGSGKGFFSRLKDRFKK